MAHWNGTIIAAKGPLILTVSLNQCWKGGGRILWSKMISVSDPCFWVIPMLSSWTGTRFSRSRVLAGLTRVATSAVPPTLLANKWRRSGLLSTVSLCNAWSQKILLFYSKGFCLNGDTPANANKVSDATKFVCKFNLIVMCLQNDLFNCFYVCS